MKKLSFLLPILLLGTIVLVFASKRNSSHVPSLTDLLIGEIKDGNVEEVPTAQNLDLMLHDQIISKLKLGENESSFEIVEREILRMSEEYFLKMTIRLKTGKEVGLYAQLGLKNTSQLYLTNIFAGCLGSCWKCQYYNSGQVAWCDCVETGGNPPVCNVLD